MGHTIVHTARHCRQDRIVDKAKCNVKKKLSCGACRRFFSSVLVLYTHKQDVLDAHI